MSTLAANLSASPIVPQLRSTGPIDQDKPYLPPQCICAFLATIKRNYIHDGVLNELTLEWLYNRHRSWPSTADQRLLCFMHQYDLYHKSSIEDEEYLLLRLVILLRRGTEIEREGGLPVYRAFRERILNQISVHTSVLISHGDLAYTNTGDIEKTRGLKACWKKISHKLDYANADNTIIHESAQGAIYDARSWTGEICATPQLVRLKPRPFEVLSSGAPSAAGPISPGKKSETIKWIIQTQQPARNPGRVIAEKRSCGLNETHSIAYGGCSVANLSSHSGNITPPLSLRNNTRVLEQERYVRRQAVQLQDSSRHFKGAVASNQQIASFPASITDTPGIQTIADSTSTANGREVAELPGTARQEALTHFLDTNIYAQQELNGGVSWENPLSIRALWNAAEANDFFSKYAEHCSLPASCLHTLAFTVPFSNLVTFEVHRAWDKDIWMTFKRRLAGTLMMSNKECTQEIWVRIRNGDVDNGLPGF
ncbi:hypothetical protein B0O99DRAFT_684923 [Bisporella sp. PMI_857]|nr:hypothetical protein B0O99DRAFT_684923 [Bisporella sp. PMI_857]